MLFIKQKETTLIFVLFTELWIRLRLDHILSWFSLFCLQNMIYNSLTDSYYQLAGMKESTDAAFCKHKYFTLK